MADNTERASMTDAPEEDIVDHLNNVAIAIERGGCWQVGEDDRVLLLKAKAEITLAFTDNQRLRARVAELEAAFITYGKHGSGCAAINPGNLGCDCGLEAAIRGATATMTEEK